MDTSIIFVCSTGLDTPVDILHRSHNIACKVGLCVTKFMVYEVLYCLLGVIMFNNLSSNIFRCGQEHFLKIIKLLFVRNSASLASEPSFLAVVLVSHLCLMKFFPSKGAGKWATVGISCLKMTHSKTCLSWVRPCVFKRLAVKAPAGPDFWTVL